VKRAVAAKQRRLKHRLQPRVAERLHLRTNFQLFFILPWDCFLGRWMLLSPSYRIRESVWHFWSRPCWLLASKIHAQTLASPNRPHSQPSIRLVERNCAFDLPSRIENLNFTGAKFRETRLSLRFYHHWCPDVSGVIKLARFPIGHPNASM
jgi:hypothetical protein